MIRQLLIDCRDAFEAHCNADDCGGCKRLLDRLNAALAEHCTAADDTKLTVQGEPVAFLRWGENAPKLDANPKFPVWDLPLDSAGNRQDFPLYAHPPHLQVAEPTAKMIDAGAQRLVSWGEDSKWPESWSPLVVAAARQDAEKVWRSMWIAAQEESK